MTPPCETASFTDAAQRLAGVMGALAGWSPVAFWAATPTEAAGVLAALAGGGAPPGGTLPGVIAGPMGDIFAGPMGDRAMIATLLKGMPDG